MRRALLLFRHDEFRLGASDMAGVALGMAAWGLVTGVAMVKGGLAVPLAVLMSLTVFAGSAQLAAVPLMHDGAPVWVVWAAALCVNLRFIIFSAGWRPYLEHLGLPQRLGLTYLAADLNYVTFLRRFPHPQRTPGQVPYFLGGAVVTWLSWQSASLTGIVLADLIPSAWGLGFAGTLALLGLTLSLLHRPATWIAAGVAASAAVAAYALPLKLNIVVAIAAAVGIALLMDPARGVASRLRRQTP